MTQILFSILLLLSLSPQIQEPSIFFSFRARKDHELNPEPDSEF